MQMPARYCNLEQNARTAEVDNCVTVVTPKGRHQMPFSWPDSWPALPRPYAPAAEPETSRAAIARPQHPASRLLHKAHVGAAIGISMHMNDGCTKIKSITPLSAAVRLSRAH